jgi:hypothetical protein
MKKKYATQKKYATPPLKLKKDAMLPQKNTYARGKYSPWVTGVFSDNPDSSHLFVRQRRGTRGQINLSHPASRWIMGFMGLVDLTIFSFLPPLDQTRWGMMLVGLFWLFFGFILLLRYLIARRMRITRKQRLLL